MDSWLPKRQLDIFAHRQIAEDFLLLSTYLSLERKGFGTSGDFLLLVRMEPFGPSAAHQVFSRVVFPAPFRR